MIIFSVSPKVTSEQYPGAYLVNEKLDECETLFQEQNALLCVAYNCSNPSKNNHEKTLFIIPKSEYTRKAYIPALNRKKRTPVQSQHTNVKSTPRRALF